MGEMVDGFMGGMGVNSRSKRWYFHRAWMIDSMNGSTHVPQRTRSETSGPKRRSRNHVRSKQTSERAGKRRSCIQPYDVRPRPLSLSLSFQGAGSVINLVTSIDPEEGSSVHSANLPVVAPARSYDRYISTREWCVPSGQSIKQ